MILVMESSLIYLTKLEVMGMNLLEGQCKLLLESTGNQKCLLLPFSIELGYSHLSREFLQKRLQSASIAGYKSFKLELI